VSSGEKYAAAAYLVVFAFVLAYVLIIGLKLQRLQRELAELAARARTRRLEEETVERREVTPVG
jgi:CcmD family protein